MSSAKVKSKPQAIHKPHPGPLLSGQSEMQLVFDSARRAQKQWAAVPSKERAQRLSHLAELLLKESESLARLIQEENGKPYVEAMSHDLGVAMAKIRWLCEHGYKTIQPRTLSTGWFVHRRAKMLRAPYGVVLVIAPWNFPVATPLSSVVTALLAGNAAILKPSEITPRCGDAIGRLIDQCDLPRGLFHLLQGDGSVGAEAIAHKPDKIVFTGSLATGKKIMQAAAAYPIPVSLELGGVDAMIVFDDADLDYAASAAVWGGMLNAGQACASVERLLVHRAIKDSLVERIVAKVQQLEAGRDLNPYTADKQREVYERHIDDAKERRLPTYCGGDFSGERSMAPMVVDADSDPTALIYREETFGPQLAVRSFSNDDEAVRLHNELWGGLSVSLFAGDTARAEALAPRLDAGLVAIDDLASTLYLQGEAPWGGTGSSGFGRSTGADGLHEMTWSKVVEAPRGPAIKLKRPWWFPYDSDQGDAVEALVRLINERHPGKRGKALAKLASSLKQSMQRAPRL